MKLIGYDSDSVFVPTLKQKNEAEKVARLMAKDREAHVYLVNGKKQYYKVYRELHEIQGDVQYLGMGLEPFASIKSNIPPNVRLSNKKPKVKSKKKIPSVNNRFKHGMLCCYCQIELTHKNHTREHVIPKHKGGKIIEPCCEGCNREKGGLMLHTFIEVMKLNNPKDYRIRNAIYLAKKHNLNF